MAPASKTIAQFWINSCRVDAGSYLIVMYTPEILAMADLGGHDLPPDLSNYINRKLIEFENTSMSEGHPETVKLDSAADSGLAENSETEISPRPDPKKMSNWCTSFIYKTDKSKYTLASNLDLWFNYHYTYMAFQADYYKWGKLVASGMEVAGIPGSPRIYSHRGQWVGSLNKRNSAYTKGRGVDYFVLEMLATRSREQETMLLLNTALTTTSYDEALKKLSKTPTFSPVYYILTGRSFNGKNEDKEGVVIEKAATYVHATYALDWQNPDKILDTWFLAQTNYDRDVPDPKDDYRRVPLEKKIAAAGFSGMNTDLAWAFLHQSPNMVPFGPQSYTFGSFLVQIDYTKSDLEDEAAAKSGRILTRKSNSRKRIGRKSKPVPEVTMKMVYWAAA